MISSGPLALFSSVDQPPLPSVAPMLHDTWWLPAVQLGSEMVLYISVSVVLRSWIGARYASVIRVQASLMKASCSASGGKPLRGTSRRR